MSITAIIGGQWGDEGKGKIVDLLCKDVNLVARFQGGANAGHTVYKDDTKIILHQIPSGILTDNCQCVLGNGMVIDPIDLVEELTMLTNNGINYKNSIYIASNAHIVTPVHKCIDSSNEEKTNQQIGTTCKGIGPAYVDKYNRCGIRANDLHDVACLKQQVMQRLDLAIKTGELSESDRSDLLITKISAISMIPAFIICISSPDSGTSTKTTESTCSTTSISICPTPTVSKIIISNPATSRTSAISLILEANPPLFPLDAKLLT